MDTEKSPTSENNELCPKSPSSANVLEEETKPEMTDASPRDKCLVPVSNSSVSKIKDSKLDVEEPEAKTEMSLDDCARSSMNQALKSEKAFIEYVMSLPSTPASKESHRLCKSELYPLATRPKLKSCSVATSATNATKVGLDHLENLCKLMEQLSELRETNAKLQKRVQYLEDLKTLHEMHKEIRSESQYGSENVLTQRQHIGLKKSLTSTDYIKSSPRGSEDYVVGLPRENEYFYKEQRPTKNARSPSGRRSRVLNNPPYDGHRRERSKSVGHEEVYDGKSKRIFPKWSKVKEAFGWESERKNSAKASKFYFGAGVAEEPYLAGARRILTDQGLVALPIPLYPDYSEKDEISPIDSYAGEAMATCAEGCISHFNSSVEDIAGFLENYRSSNHHWKRDSGSSEKRLSLLEAPSEGLRRQKSTSSPGSDKIRTYQDMIDLKPKSLTIERDIDPEQAFAKFDKEESKKPHKSPWGRVKTIIERRRDSLRRRHFRRPPSQGPLLQHRYTLEDTYCDAQDVATAYDPQRKPSDDQYIPSSYLSKMENREDIEKIPKRKRQNLSVQSKDIEREKTRQTVQALRLNPAERSDNTDNRVSSIPDREVMFRTPGSSPQLHRKSTWMKMKNVLRSKKEGESAPTQSSQSMPSSPNGVQDVTFDFEGTEGLEDNPDELECFDNDQEITRVGSDSYVHKLSLAASAPVTDIMLELQRNLSDDFNRKMQEWERIRNAGTRPITSPKWERKNSGSKSRKKSDKAKVERFEKPLKPKIKDLTWLEKELQKIEKEKQRLSKEKEKYEERAVRLERLRQTVLTARNSNKKEVLVKTSAGEFRFEGISDAFTKKLYEWETKRGLGPELSTIALLDSSLGANNKNCLTIQQIDKCGNLQRALSRSESSIAEIGQPSHTSSNSLPSLKPPDIGDLERIHHHSRANSEPDLSSFTGMSSNPMCVQTSFADQSDLTAESSRDTLGAEPRDSYVHPEVTQLIDSDVEEVLENERQEQRDENYYSLLEENVILLEQLKNKEEICRRLENELELLDEKVDEMNKHHQQEMERYREKLWEMHKPDSTPREVQGCLKVMVELRSRIENLEQCSEKLKNEKETLEDSFRFHSAEQEHMTLDLLDKMRELHAAGGGAGSTDPQSGMKKEKESSQTNFDIKIVERLQDLSAQLVKQTRELEQALAERTRQICQLRWELLHRDVSTVKLQTELHSAHIQGTSPQNRATCDVKRAKYAHFRSWSSEEASNRSKQLQECGTQNKDRPKASDLPESYYKLPKTEFQASELSNTVHELNRELIRLSTAAESFLGCDGNMKYDGSGHSGTKEIEENTRRTEYLETENEGSNITPTLAHSSCDELVVMAQHNEIRNTKISVRRNSAGSISITSGIEPGGSESSSINDENNRHIRTMKPSPKLYRKPSHKTSWTDSESSTEEENFTRIPICSRPDSSAAWEMGHDMILKHPIIKRKMYNTYDSDESREAKNVNDDAITSTKRKINYKALKNARKLYGRNGQFPDPNEGATRQSSSAQSESDTAISSYLFKTNKDLLTNICNSEIAVISPSKDINRHFLRSCQSADQVTTKLITMTQSKPDTSARKLPIKKDLFNRTYKSHSMRAPSSSDSKIPKSNRTNIKKSESCHEGKERRKEVSKGDQHMTKNSNELFRTGLGAFKWKNNVEDNGIEKIPSTNTKHYDEIEKCGVKPRTKENTLKNRDCEKKQYKCIEAKLLSHNENDLQAQATLKRKKISLKDSRTNSINIETEDGDCRFGNQEQHTFSGKEESEDKNSQSPSATSTSTFVLKLPKKKHKTPQLIDDSRSEQCNSCSHKMFVQSQSDYDVTVILNQDISMQTPESNFPKKHNTRLEEENVVSEQNFPTEHLPDTFTTNSSNNCRKLSNEDLKSTNSQTRMQRESLNEDQNDENLPNSKNNSIYATTDNVNDQRPKINECTTSNSTEQTKITTDVAKPVVEKETEEFANSNCTEDKNQKDLGKNVMGTEIVATSTKQEIRDRNVNYIKSPSAPQLDWKKSCAKKVSRQGAPNVKTLIEKYNKKVLENQSQRSPCSSNYNSPAIARKISAPLAQKSNSDAKIIPFSSTPCTPKIITASSFYTPLIFKPTNLDLFHSQTSSPPTSPASRARSEALLKAKEKFISSSSILTLTTETLTKVENTSSTNETTTKPMPCKSDQNNQQATKRSATDSEITKCQNPRARKRNVDNECNRISICSNKSSDSMNMVLCKTGETCQESRFSKREKQKISENQSKEQELQFKTSKSLSNSSIFKAVTGHDIKLPASFLRLRRSRKKKDMTTVSQLCRQSLLLGTEGSSLATDDTAKSPRSCPSSPELKSKSKSKPSWFQRGLFKLK